MNVADKQHTHSDTRPVSVLAIAGSDSGGGAGIQADLKTIAAHGLHGLTAIAALTAQNTRAVTAVHTPPPQFLVQQIDALFDDFRIASVKIGMLATRALIESVASALRRHAATQVVLDPVMIASSGASLLEPDAVQGLIDALFPLTDVLTPTLPEAEALLGRRIRDAADMPEAAHALRALGARAVLLKGGHLEQGDALVDIYCDAQQQQRFTQVRLPLEGHGTGCTLSSAIASNLARGITAPEACERACAYVHGALRHATHPGRGRVAVLDHFWRQRAG